MEMKFEQPPSGTESENVFQFSHVLEVMQKTEQLQLSEKIRQTWYTWKNTIYRGSFGALALMATHLQDPSILAERASNSVLKNQIAVEETGTGKSSI